MNLKKKQEDTLWLELGEWVMGYVVILILIFVYILVQLQTMLCYSYICDMIIIAWVLKSNINYIKS